MNCYSTPTGESKVRRLHITVAILISVLIFSNMALIFFFSSESGEVSGNRSEGITHTVIDITCPDYDELPPAEQESILASVHHLIRKTAHFLEFALLGFLSACLLLHLRRRLIPRILPWHTWILPAVFGLIYAASDEIHQIFSGRGPRVTDVLIDGAGVLCGIAVSHAVVWLIRSITTHTTKQGRRTSTHENDTL